MIVTCCFISVFAVLIKVGLQVTVEGVINGSVVLPCSSTKDAPLQEICVNWIHNGSEHVYSLLEGKESLSAQNPRYRDRAESFSDEYLRRNFSIKLKKLQHTDAGDFTCYITHSSKHFNVVLLLKEPEKEQSNHSQETPSGSVITSDLWIFLYIVLPLLLLLLLLIVPAVVYFRFRSRRRTSGPL